MSTIPCSFEAGHKGAEVISSACLKPSWAKDGKTFIYRHNCKKKKKKGLSVFRNAEQRSIEQSRIEPEKGAPKPKTEQRSRQTPTQTLLGVRHCDSMGWCLHRQMATDEKNAALKTAGKISKYANEELALCMSCGRRDSPLHKGGHSRRSFKSETKDVRGTEGKWKNQTEGMYLPSRVTP